MHLVGKSKCGHKCVDKELKAATPKQPVTTGFVASTQAQSLKNLC